MAFPNMTSLKQRLRGKSSADLAINKAQLVEETPNPTRNIRESGISSYGEAKTDVQTDKVVNATRPTLLGAMRSRAKAAMNKRAGKAPKGEASPPPTPIQEQEMTSEEAGVEAQGEVILDEHEDEEEVVLAADLCKVAAVAVGTDELPEDGGSIPRDAEARTSPTNDLRPESSSSSSLLTTVTLLLVVCAVVAMAATRAR